MTGMSRMPARTASSTTYWMVGLSTSGIISLGCALVAGRNRVPSPAAGKTPLRTFTRRISSLTRADRGPGLAIERVLDGPAQLVLGLEAPGGVHLDHQADDALGAAELDDTLRLGRFQRPSARP